jgi:hypothetical protein
LAEYDAERPHEQSDADAWKLVSTHSHCTHVPRFATELLSDRAILTRS